MYVGTVVPYYTILYYTILYIHGTSMKNEQGSKCGDDESQSLAPRAVVGRSMDRRTDGRTMWLQWLLLSIYLSIYPSLVYAIRLSAHAPFHTHTHTRRLAWMSFSHIVQQSLLYSLDDDDNDNDCKRHKSLSLSLSLFQSIFTSFFPSILIIFPMAKSSFGNGHYINYYYYYFSNSIHTHRHKDTKTNFYTRASRENVPSFLHFFLTFFLSFFLSFFSI